MQYGNFSQQQFQSLYQQPGVPASPYQQYRNLSSSNFGPNFSNYTGRPYTHTTGGNDFSPAQTSSSGLVQYTGAGLTPSGYSSDGGVASNTNVVQANARYRSQVEALQTQLQEEQESKNAISGELETNKRYLKMSNDEVQRLNDQEEELRKEITELKEAKKELERTKTELHTSQLEVKRLKAYHQADQKELESLRGMVKQLQSNNERLSNQAHLIGGRLMSDSKASPGGPAAPASHHTPTKIGSGSNYSTPSPPTNHSPPPRGAYSSSLPKENPFFGLEVADGIKYQDQKHCYGAVKVIKVSGPAAQAGVEPHDFITHVNGKAVETLPAFNAAISNVRPGQIVSLILEREGKMLSTNIQVHATATPPGRTNIIQVPTQ